MSDMLVGKRSFLSCCAVLLGLLPSVSLAESEPATVGGEAALRRLTPEQYRQIVVDIFGPGIKLGGRFEPGIRANGLLAVGTSKVSVTGTGLEQFDGMARTVASQVVDPQHRDTLIPCKPHSDREPDAACAGQFITAAGRYLYRRPLTQDEIQAKVQIAESATTKLKDFYVGIEMSLISMLESPQFLFRREISEPDSANPASAALSPFSKASRLSFFLWNTAPDAVLLAAAEKGNLNSNADVARQVDRMLHSPRLEAGIRAFFTDFLQFDTFSTLAKDATIYPKFTLQIAVDAQEQTLRTIVDHVLARDGDYRDLYTTRRTFLTRDLGAIYGLPIPKTTANGAPDDWVAYEYPEGDPRGAGILSHASFVALHSHPGRSSPTLRGKALREVLLCQKVPDPPGNVNFTVVQDTKNPQFRTARERVTAHRTDPTCAGCHKLIDPMGLGLENFDGASGFRTTENGVAIDSSGELDGISFKDAPGLGHAVHEDPATSSCLVSRLYAYAVGRPAAKGEADFVKYLERNFKADGYKVPDLMKTIATSDAFFRVPPMQTGALNLPGRLASDSDSAGGNR